MMYSAEYAMTDEFGQIVHICEVFDHIPHV